MNINRRERRARAVTVTKALLLGYTFKRNPFAGGGVLIRKPDGLLLIEEAENNSIVGVRRFMRPIYFETEWHAAVAILQRLGVYDEEDIRRSKGAGSSKVRRLYKRRRKSRRVAGVVESPWLRQGGS